MKKTIRTILAILLVLTLIPFAAAAEELVDPAEIAIPRVGGEDLDADPPADADPGSGTDVIPLEPETTDEEEPAVTEYVLSGTNIPVIDGIYSYKLVIRPPEYLVFDNDLENLYQGVKGRYQLHYEILEADNHIMIVKGVFEDILTESPLVPQGCKDRISEDSYSYVLELRTKEGFTFENELKYLVDGLQHGYKLYYSYDLETNSHTLELERPGFEERHPILAKLKDLLQRLKDFFASLFSFKLPGC